MTLVSEVLSARSCTPAMVTCWDTGCRNVAASGAFGRWLGLSPDEIVGAHKRDVLGEEVYAKALPYIEGVLSGTPQAFERLYTDRRGRVRPAHVVLSPDTVGGRIVGFVSIAIDLTLPGPPTQRSRRPRHVEEVEGVFIEHLTVKEQRVLELLTSYLPTDDIAARLQVSTNTVKSHMKSIYRKLGVESRSAAVHRGVAANLLSRDTL